MALLTVALVVTHRQVHINFYVRLFVRVYTGPGEVKKPPL